jgi:hypothetical protein
MRPGDRLVCAFIRPTETGGQFKEWPLHITIVPWFRLSVPSADLANELQQNFIGSSSFKVDIGPEDHFGYKKRKVVNLAFAEELLRVEGQTRRTLHLHKAWVVDEADKTRRRKYLPHVTAQTSGRVHEGDSFTCNELYIVEQKGDHKEVVAEIPLD